MSTDFAERVARRFVSRYFLSMSMEDAYKVLGLSPGASKEEINKAYRAKVFETHPDRGGDPTKMVEVNVAKDILDNKQAPSRSGPSYEPSYTYNEPEDEDDKWAEEKRATEVLDKEGVKDKKKNHWWVPPHNFMINRAMMEWNFWSFTILPFFPDKRSYRPAKNGKPEGIVIHPIWDSVRELRGLRMLTVPLAEKLIAHAKGQPTVHDTVKEELHWIEEKFSISIPEAIKARLVTEAPKIAARRMSVDRLRVKSTLVPLDGSKPIDLGSWD
jgi:curved DNA-binding protein CbpA